MWCICRLYVVKINFLHLSFLNKLEWITWPILGVATSWKVQVQRNFPW